MDKRILGVNAVYSTDCSETGVNNNVIICGGSGSGKTMSITEPLFLETYESCLVATVTKRRIVKKYKPLFEKRGYIVQELNFVNPDQSDISYDPLHYVKTYEDVTFLATALVYANPKKETGNQDPYWNEAALSLLSAEISYILLTMETPTFTDVLMLHDEVNIKCRDDLISTSIDSKFKELEEKYPNSYTMNCWKSFSQLPARTAGCVLSTLNAVLDTIFTPQLRSMISMEKKVNFEQMAMRKTVLFVSTSAVNPMLHSFINIFYAQMFKQLFEFAERRVSGRLPIPVHIVCDDFGTGSKINNFAQYISIFREHLISVSLLIQSESQLETMYGSEATTIINNCDTYVYLGGMDLQTCRNMSSRLDSPLDEVLSLGVGKEYIFRRGQVPIITKRYNILDNKLYNEITKQYEARMRKEANKNTDYINHTVLSDFKFPRKYLGAAITHPNLGKGKIICIYEQSEEFIAGVEFNEDNVQALKLSWLLENCMENKSA